MAIKTVLGDITKIDADAIVNAANEEMLSGGGVDGAIRRAAGPELYKQCLALEEVRPGVRCPTGEAVVTSGYNLPAKYIIHTVGPIWRGGNRHEAELLAMCYKNCFINAEFFKLRSIALPSISTGAYGYPAEAAARIAIREAREALKTNPDLEIVFVLFNGPRDPVDMKALYDRILAE